MCAYTKYPGMPKYTRRDEYIKSGHVYKNYISFKVLLLANNAVNTLQKFVSSCEISIIWPWSISTMSYCFVLNAQI